MFCCTNTVDTLLWQEKSNDWWREGAPLTRCSLAEYQKRQQIWFSQKTRLLVFACVCACVCQFFLYGLFLAQPVNFIFTLGQWLTATFEFWTQRVTLEAWDPSEIWSEWCLDKKTKRQNKKRKNNKEKTYKRAVCNVLIFGKGEAVVFTQWFYRKGRMSAAHM